MFNITWFTFRVPVFLVLFGFLFDIEFTLMILGLFLFHINLGLKVIFNDYIHFKKLKIALVTLIRILIVELLVYTLGFLL